MDQRAPKRDLVLSLFPLPSMLRMDASGLEISEHSVKYLSFSTGRHRKINAYGNKDLPQGVVVGGEIKDISGFAQVLTELRKETGISRVHVSLPEQKGYIFRMTIPRQGELTLAEAVQFRLEEHVPLPPSDVVFDADIIEEESTQSEYVLNVTAFPRGTIDAYFEALLAAGFLPLSFEIESQAAARAVLPREDNQARMIVDFGETRTSIAVAQRGVVRFTTSLELAGASLALALTKAGMSSEEIARLKNEEGIAGMGSGKTKEALMPIVLKLRDEIQRHFVYWHTHGEAEGVPHLPISSIILCGGNANLRGLPEYLSDALHVPVSLGEVWSQAFPLSSYIPPIPHNHSLRYATVTGLALRGGANFT